MILEDLESWEKKVNIFDVESSKILDFNFRLAMNRFSTEFKTSHMTQGNETILLQTTGTFFGYHGILLENISTTYLIEVNILPREFVNLVWLIDAVELQKDGSLKYLLMPQNSKSVFFKCTFYNSGYQYKFDYSYRYIKNHF